MIAEASERASDRRKHEVVISVTSDATRQLDDVPPADQEICRRVEARVVNAGKDAGSDTISHGSVTNGEERRHDSSVPLNMTEIKGSSTPGAPRQLNVLNNFKYEYFVAGISGGVVSTLMLHPLDLIKIRFAGE